MGSRKSTRSMDAVTQVERACRIAATAAVLSTSAITTPPNTFPRLLASGGSMSAEDSCCDSRTVRLERALAMVTFATVTAVNRRARRGPRMTSGAHGAYCVTDLYDVRTSARRTEYGAGGT